MMIKNIVFDLGGVVLGRDFSRFGELVAGSFSFFGHGVFPHYWKEFDRGVLTEQQVAEFMAADTGNTPQQCFADIELAVELLAEIPETVALVDRLKDEGMRLYVLSNMPAEFWNRMQHFDVMKRFDGFLISSQEKMNKPEERFFRLLNERFGIEFAESLFVDDRLANVEAAQQLGMKAVQYALPDGPQQVLDMVDAWR